MAFVEVALIWYNNIVLEVPFSAHVERLYKLLRTCIVLYYGVSL